MSLDEAVLQEVRDNPGRNGLEVIATFFAVDHIPRAQVAESIAHLINHGRITLDGEHRIWPA